MQQFSVSWRNILPSVGEKSFCRLAECVFLKWYIVKGRGLVVEIAVRAGKALCLFGVGVLDERFAFAPRCAVLAGDLVEEIFLQIGVGRQPATRLPERGRTQARAVNIAVILIDGLAKFVILL